MRKILILTNSLDGLYSFRRELIDQLIGNEYKVIISAPSGNKEEYFKSMGCGVIKTKINRRSKTPFNDIKLLFFYLHTIRRISPDVVLTYTIKPNIYGGIACRFTKTPYIINITGLGTAVKSSGWLQKITLTLYRLGSKKADCVFFQNSENREFMLKRGIGRRNGRLIPGSGVNLQYYRLLDYPSADGINFIFIGRIMKEKGIEQYLKAATFIKQKYPTTYFHVIGSCEEAYQNRLERYQSLGIIQYHGVQNDVRKFYRISHCIVHPTYYPEGISNVLLESAASGRPIITTNRSGCKEIVDEGISGYLVEEKNLQSLMCAIEKFLLLDNEERKQMGLAGRAKVEKEFDRQVVIAAYMEEIERND